MDKIPVERLGVIPEIVKELEKIYPCYEGGKPVLEKLEGKLAAVRWAHKVQEGKGEVVALLNFSNEGEFTHADVSLTGSFQWRKVEIPQPAEPETVPAPKKKKR